MDLDWHANSRAQTTERAVAQDDISAMRAGNIARDREPQTRAALVLVACVVEPQERLEYLFPHAGRNPRTVIVDRDGQIAMVAMSGNRDGDRESSGVRYQIVD